MFSSDLKENLFQCDKKKTRECRKKKLLFSTIDDACHEPTSSGPCKDGAWFVAVKGQLKGVCRIIECTEDDNSITGFHFQGEGGTPHFRSQSPPLGSRVLIATKRLKSLFYMLSKSPLD